MSSCGTDRRVKMKGPFVHSRPVRSPGICTMPARAIGALALLLSLAGLSSAQQPHAIPQPPAKSVLDRLNLRQEWAIHLPLEGKRDAVTMIQSLDDQLFVQTRTGHLLAVDAATGRLQWSASLGDGRFTTTYPVAVNSRLVFVVHVTKLYALYRYTGLVEFQMDLETMPTAGLSADENMLYAVLAIRPGYGGSTRLEVYQLPRPIPVPVTAAGKDVIRGDTPPNPVDTLMQRYPTSGVPRTDMPEVESTPRPSLRTVPSGSFAGSTTPSLAVAQTVNPPYYLESGARTPELLTVPSLRQPYRIFGNDGRAVQHTASVAVIPPSVAAALSLSDLRPKGVRPTKLVELALTSRILYPLLLTPLRAWAATDSEELIAASTKQRVREVYYRATALVSATPGQAGDMGYFPLADGNLLAIDLNTGNLVGGANVIWRSTVGGLMDHPPLVTRDAIYASGENSGVARIDRTTGKVLWKSESSADTVLASTDDFVYVRNNQGRMLMYDTRQVLDPSLGRVRPLTGADLPAFNVPFTNTVTDRLYLAADNGLLVCLREATPKYSRPVRMAPDPPKPVEKKDPGAIVPTAPPAP